MSSLTAKQLVNIARTEKGLQSDGKGNYLLLSLHSNFRMSEPQQHMKIRIRIMNGGNITVFQRKKVSKS